MTDLLPGRTRRRLRALERRQAEHERQVSAAFVELVEHIGAQFVTHNQHLDVWAKRLVADLERTLKGDRPGKDSLHG